MALWRMFGCTNVNQQAMLCYVFCIFEPMSTTASLVSHLFQYLFRLMEIPGMCIQQNVTVYLGMLSSALLVLPIENARNIEATFPAAIKVWSRQLLLHVSIRSIASCSSSFSMTNSGEGKGIQYKAALWCNFWGFSQLTALKYNYERKRGENRDRNRQRVLLYREKFLRAVNFAFLWFLLNHKNFCKMVYNAV